MAKKYNPNRDFVFNKVPADGTDKTYKIVVSNVGQGIDKAVVEARKIATKKYAAEEAAKRAAEEAAAVAEVQETPAPFEAPVVAQPVEPVVEPPSGDEALQLATNLASIQASLLTFAADQEAKAGSLAEMMATAEQQQQDGVNQREAALALVKQTEGVVGVYM